MFSSSALVCLSLLLFLSLLSPVLSYKWTGRCGQYNKGRLTVTVVRAWNLKGNWLGRTDAYVKLKYGSYSRQTHVVKSNNPHWNARYYLGYVYADSGLKIEVWDKDPGRDNCLGACTMYLKQGTHKFTCRIQRGGVEVMYSLTCNRWTPPVKWHQSLNWRNTWGNRNIRSVD